MKYRNVRINSVTALILSLSGAAFFALGRTMFGVGGWFVFFSIPAAGIVAVAFLCLWLIPVRRVKERAEAGPYKAFGWRESWAFIAVTAFLFLAGFFMVDAGDTEESVKSAFTQIVRRWALELSSILFWLCALGVIVSYVVGVVVAVKGRRSAVGELIRYARDARLSADALSRRGHAGRKLRRREPRAIIIWSRYRTRGRHRSVGPFDSSLTNGGAPVPSRAWSRARRGRAGDRCPCPRRSR